MTLHTESDLSAISLETNTNIQSANKRGNNIGALNGLGFALKTQPAEGESSLAVDEYHWGGLMGTHSWMAPAANLTGLCFTQRMPGFWHPFSHEFQKLVYAAAERGL